MSIIPDASQRKAIYTSPDQSMIILAPPGYGKTFVMPRRIEYLLKSRNLVPPERVLGLTFTNAAANEMKSRLEKRINPRYLDFIDAMTFHSFCYQVLRAYGNVIGIPTNFGIMLEKTKIKSFSDYWKHKGLSYQLNDWQEYVEWEKNIILKLVQIESSNHKPLFLDYWKHHKSNQMKKREFDFNHLLWITRYIFMNYADILKVYRNVYRYILVDEFQDTSPIQYSILQLLSLGNSVEESAETLPRPVYIFADDWQSIYRFLGAMPHKQIAHAKSVLNCDELVLTEDHRSSSPSLSIFCRIIRSLENSTESLLPLDLPLYILSNPTELAVEVNKKVSEWVNENIALHEIAILAREKKQLLGVEQNLMYPYLSIPDLQASSLEKHKIFDILAVISKSKKWAKKGCLHDAVSSKVENSAQVREGDLLIQNSILELARTYDLHYPNLNVSEKAKRMINEALLEINWGQSFRQLCRDRIFVGTIHSSKGLEFKAVALIHLDQSSFPSWFFTCRYCKNPDLANNLSFDDILNDEWKVFYVGVTRAREKLSLFSSATSNDGYSTPVTCLINGNLWECLNKMDLRDQETRKNQIRCILT